LLRHYGSTAPAPVDLEARLLASVQQQTADISARERTAIAWRERRVSRRRVLRLVAFGGAGLGVLSIGLEGLRQVEATLIGQDTNRPAYT
jgi:Tfp pilus assembly protein PilN